MQITTLNRDLGQLDKMLDIGQSHFDISDCLKQVKTDIQTFQSSFKQDYDFINFLWNENHLSDWAHNDIQNIKQMMTSIEYQIENGPSEDTLVAKSFEYQCPEICRKSSTNSTSFTVDLGKLNIDKDNFRKMIRTLNKKFKLFEDSVKEFAKYTVDPETFAITSKLNYAVLSKNYKENLVLELSEKYNDIKQRIEKIDNNYVCYEQPTTNKMILERFEKQKQNKLLSMILNYAAVVGELQFYTKDFQNIFEDIDFVEFRTVNLDSDNQSYNDEHNCMTPETHFQKDTKLYKSSKENVIFSPTYEFPHKDFPSSNDAKTGFDQSYKIDLSCKLCMQKDQCSCKEFSSVLIGKGLVSKKPKHSHKTPTKKQSVMNLEPDSDSKRIESQYKNEPMKISTRKQIIYSNFTSQFSDDEVNSYNHSQKISSQIDSKSHFGKNIQHELDADDNTKLIECNKNLQKFLDLQKFNENFDEYFDKSEHEYGSDDNTRVRLDKNYSPINTFDQMLSGDFNKEKIKHSNKDIKKGQFNISYKEQIETTDATKQKTNTKDNVFLNDEDDFCDKDDLEYRLNHADEILDNSFGFKSSTGAKKVSSKDSIKSSNKSRSLHNELMMFGSYHLSKDSAVKSKSFDKKINNLDKGGCKHVCSIF